MHADVQDGCAWDHSECTGTPHCPPRCPRFVDATGRPLLVSPLSEARLPDLTAMYRAFGPAHRSMGLPPRDDRRTEQWVRSLHDRGTNLIATDRTRVLGHSGYVPGDEDVPEMLVYVHPEAQGRGIGTELVRQAIAWAVADGHDGLRLHVESDNEAALHVYRTLGFETVDHEGSERTMRLSFDAPVASAAGLPPSERPTA